VRGGSAAPVLPKFTTAHPYRIFLFRDEPDGNVASNEGQR
jgi:hypothetical protein